MKALIPFLLCLSPVFVFGQWSSSDINFDAEVAFDSEQKESLFLKRYRGVFLGIGPRYLNTDPGQIKTDFVDDSPSADQFSSTYEIEDGYTQMAINFGYKGGRYRGPSHDFLFDVSFGQNNTAKFAYSWGWNFLTKLKTKDLVIRAALQGVLGNTVFNIGELKNNAAYIQIGEKQYYEEELNVKLRAQSITFAPRIDLSYVFAGKWDFFIKAAYDVSAANTNPALELSVPDRLHTEDSPGASTLDIDGPNPLVTYNGEKLESLPYTTGGLRLTLGLSYLWNR